MINTHDYPNIAMMLQKAIEADAWDTLNFHPGTRVKVVLERLSYDVLHDDMNRIGTIELLDMDNGAAVMGEFDVDGITKFNQNIPKAIKLLEGENFELVESAIGRGYKLNSLRLRIKRKNK